MRSFVRSMVKSMVRTLDRATLSPIFHPAIESLYNRYGGDSAGAAIRNSIASVNVYDETASTIIRTAAINEHRAEGYRRVENLAAFTDLPSTQVITVVSGHEYQVTIGKDSAVGATAVCSDAFTGTLTGDATDRLAINTSGAPEAAGSTTLTITITGAITELFVEDVTGQSNQNPSEYVANDTVLGAELVTNGTFDTDVSSWVPGAGKITWQSGGFALCERDGGSGAAGQQALSIKANKKHLLSFNLKSVSHGMRITVGGTVAYTSASPSLGMHSYTFDTATTAGIFLTMLDHINANMEIDDVSVHEATTGRQVFTTDNANTVASNIVTEAVGDPLFPTKTIDGTARNDTKADWAAGVWAAGSECNYQNKWYSTVAGGTDSATFGDTITWVEKGFHNNIYGLLTEPLGENLLIRSEEFNNVAWTDVNGAATGGVIVAPDGTATGDTFTEDGIGASGYVFNTDHVGAMGASEVFTVSTFIKYGSRQYVQFIGGTSVNGFGCVIDLVGGTVTATGVVGNGVLIASNIYNAGNGWYRASVTGHTGATTNAGYYDIFVTDVDTWTAGVPAIAPATETTHLWGAQLEKSPVLTSYIPTTTAPVTRATEAGTIKWDIAGNFSNAAGVMVVDFISSLDKWAWQQGIVSVGASNASVLYKQVAAGVLFTTDGSNTEANNTAYVANNCYRIVVRWSATTGKMEIGLLDLSIYGAAWAWSTEGTYDGAYTLDAFIILMRSIVEPHTFRNLPLIYGQDMTIAQIEAKFS